ncbi:KRI1-like family C-terminal-domain-containing protein [Calycina marina]|uniref:KRI1-like family C-terminal-domain-containing protein n=1 Tax=Calycina marina TaxID=1763456 RepID=A0A9P7ZAL3_9HELO|nr:KRI1-like family C-terminal-domain-containing protein [Calycina marina]
MGKRKAETLAHDGAVTDSKKTKLVKTEQKPFSLMDDSDSENSSKDGGMTLQINEEYAKKFEHNKKREDMARLEEKFNQEAKPKKGQYGDKYDEDSEDSDDTDEDDMGILATERLDAEISATLQALRSKDPRVYDEKVTFYAPIEDEHKENEIAESKAKPMFLSDYHRENLLKGHNGAEEEEEDAPKTFVQQQADLKETIAKEMNAAAGEVSGSEDGDGGFLIPKTKQKKEAVTEGGIHPSRAAKVKVDVAVADKDPETFLSNFLSARAWMPSDGARFQPLESDDEEEDARAEIFESAYNLRFEDPKGSNELLKSYARDVAAAKSVRRDEPNNRKKQRDAIREKREAEQAKREEEKAQLRRLKIEEMEEKLKKIKQAAGLRGKALGQEEWAKILDEGYDDKQWDAEFSKHFGEDYYAEQEGGSESDEEAAGATKKKKVKKPKWDDDIDIMDLVPEFVEEEKSQKEPAFSLSDEEDAEDAEEIEDGEGLHKPKSSKDRQQEKAAKKKAARIEKKKIEDLVDNRLELDLPLKSKQPTKFRYRETSPTSFGLTARDILMAPDTSLNQFAGLKKMATFRDVDKKKKDKKYLGKKARLREWRRETFGNEEGPEIIIGANADDGAAAADDVDIVEGEKRKKRSRKNKSKKVEA